MRISRQGTVWLSALGLALLCFAPATLSQESAPNIADSWVIKVKSGQEAEFEQAFKQHIATRKANGDVRAWQTWVPVTGDELDRYIVRFCCSQWPDLDAYEDWTAESGALADWNEKVHGYVAQYAHYFGEVDLANSKWSATAPPKFVGVTDFHPKMSAGPSIAEHVAALSDAAKAMEWPYEWAWMRPIGGDPGLSLVVPYDSFAAMKPPEKDFPVALAEKMGAVAAGGLFEAWSDNFDRTTYTIYRHRPDMSIASED